MKIIDAHLHLFPEEESRFEEKAQSVGHHNSRSHLREVYEKLNIVHGVIMGNRSMSVENHQYPADLFHYCVGMDSTLLSAGEIPNLLELLELNLRRTECCGVKLYPGYNKLWLTDELYQPVYELAARYGKPVAIHMGLTSMPNAHLKYCHPLTLDEVAADHPDTQFVMCHFGNPFFESAAAVIVKNPNVAADLSGFLDGRVDLVRFQTEQAGWLGLLRTWLTAIGSWDRLIFGTDWPIVNLEEYIGFIKLLVPEAQWDAVFFENANRIYQLGL